MDKAAVLIINLVHSYWIFRVKAFSYCQRDCIDPNADVHTGALCVWCSEMQAGAKLSLNRQFMDERWSKHRVVTCLDWSPQVTREHILNLLVRSKILPFHLLILKYVIFICFFNLTSQEHQCLLFPPTQRILAKYVTFSVTHDMFTHLHSHC